MSPPVVDVMPVAVLATPSVTVVMLMLPLPEFVTKTPPEFVFAATSLSPTVAMAFPLAPMPVCASSSRSAVAGIVNVPLSLRIEPLVISVTLPGAVAIVDRLNAPSIVIELAVVVPLVWPMTRLDASSTKLISVLLMPKFASPAPISTAFAEPGAMSNVPVPASIVASAVRLKSPPLMSMFASVSESVDSVAPASEIRNVPEPSPSTSALMSINPATPCPPAPVVMKLTRSASALSSVIPVSAFTSTSPPSEVTLPLIVTEPSLDVSVTLSLSPVVEI